MRKTVCLITLCFLSVLSTPSWAKRTYGMRPLVYTEIQAIQVMVNEKQWSQVVEAIQTLQKKSLNQYEQAQTFDIQGIAEYQQGNFDNAIASYQHILDLKEHIPEGMYQRTIRTLGQLSMMAEDYTGALEYSQLLLTLQQDISLYMMMSQAYFRLDQFQNALDALNSGKALLVESERKPKENWLLLENAIHHALGDYPAMLAVLESLVRYYPKSDYLLYTANVNGELGHTDKQLGLLETLYEAGELTRRSQLMNLASLYVLEGAPFKGGNLLKRAIDQQQMEADEKVLNLLVNAWLTSGESELALQALTQLTEVNPSGQNLLRLAYQHFDMGQWKDTTLAVKQALTSEELEDPGEAWMLTGMAELNLKHFGRAQTAFINAANYADDKKLAKQWLKYTDNEMAKYAQLSEQEARSLGAVLN